MQNTLKKVLSFVLVLVMVLGIIPYSAMADEVQVANNSGMPTSMEGLSIAYPYNTETIKLTQTPVSRFDALTFESARQEVESAQMILTPSFNVTSFELIMNDMYNEKGNLIPSYAFEVYIQHYFNVTGSTNTPNFGDFKSLDYNLITNRTYVEDVFHPRGGNGTGMTGVYPDALIPQDAAIAAGENTIVAGNNKGIWVNLNVGAAAPGNYSGSATLIVNDTEIQIPVSIHIYDVELPEEVHTKTSIGIWWDQLQAGEGYISQDLADSYYDYLISKRIQPWSQYNHWYTTEGLVEYVVEKATYPSVSNYLLYYTANGKQVDRASVVTTLTAIINKNIELVNAGNNVDLFKKAYFYFTNVDEPAGGSDAATYADVQATIDVLDSVKAELAPLLAEYPALQESFLSVANIVTGPNPTDRTYHMEGCPNYSNHSKLTSTYNSFIYAPQYHYMQTAEQRNLYMNDAEVWWYGCCHPINPYPTFHINSPLVNSRALGFMMYEYGISGQLYSSANYWGAYDNNSIVLYDYWNGYDAVVPGDQILVYPGSDYGVDGPIGSIRIESIRESNEDYEYLWLLENEFGISNIPAYTAGLYEGVVVTGVYDGQTIDPDGDGNTDASAIYHTRRIALLSELEELNVATNGATEIEPGQENFVRGTAFDAGVGTIVRFDEADYAGIVFDYKLTNDGDIAVTLRSPNDVPYYGVYYFVSSGELNDYSGITTEKLSDGYVRVTMNTAMMDYTNSNINRDNVPATLNKLDILNWGSAGGYVDNVQLLTDAADIYTPETKADDLIHMTVFDNVNYTTAAYYYVDNYVKAEGSTAALKVNTASNVHLCWDLRKEEGGMLDFSTGILSAYFYFANGNPYAEAQLYDNSWASARAQFTFEDVGGGWYYGTLKTNAADLTVRDLTKTILLRLWFNKGTTIYLDGLNFEKLVDKNDMFTGGSWISGNQWTAANNMTYMNNCTETYGEESISAWKFSATAANTNQWAQFMMGMTQSYDMRDYYLVFDAKVDGVSSQQLSIRPRTGADGAMDPCNNTVLNLTNGWNTYTVDFAAALKAASSVEDLAIVQRIFLVFNFAATTGSERSVIIDNVRLVEKACQHKNTTTTTVDATCTSAGSVTVTCDKCGEIISTESIPTLEHSYASVVTAPTFTANGFTTFTCSSCGDSYIAEKISAYTASVKNWNIALSDEISATFNLDIDSRLENAQISVTVGGYPVSSEMLKAEDGTYVLTVKVAVAQMMDEIAVQVVSGDMVSNQMIYTIRQYAEYILNGNYSETTKSLVKAMLNYGAAAQIYFGYNDDADQLANKGYEVENTVEIPTVEATNKVTGSVEGIKFYGASLVFESKIAVRFYFTVEGNIDDYSFSVGDKPVLKNGMYYVEVSDINPQDYTKEIVLTVNDILSVSYSPLIYISRKYYGSDNTKLVDLVAAMYQYHLAAVTYVEESNMRGESFTGGVTKTTFLSTDAVENLQFDYKLTTDGDIHVIFRAPDWKGFYGDFEFNAEGEAVDYDGITTEKLPDGYIRVTVRFAQLGRTGCVNNRDNAPASVGIFDVYEFGTASGYIDNIQLDVELPPEEIIRGEEFSGGVTKTTFLSTSAVENLQFDYKLTTDGDIHVILRAPDWKGFYGDFELNAEGEAVDYDGITTEKLPDGYIRVTVRFSQLGRTGCVNNRDNAPASVGIFDVYEFGTASGYIDNIQLDVELPDDEQPTEPEEPDVPAEPEVTIPFVAKTGVTTSVKTAYESISFDYKLTSDGVMGVVLRGADAWLSFYGEYYFNANGETIDYAGITTEMLDNGYIHVIMYLDELTRSGCVDNRDSAPANVGVLDIYGGFTTADGAIANIEVDVPVEPTETIAFVAKTGMTTGVTTAYESVTFDYKLTSDGVMGVVLRGADAWLSFYGEFYFNVHGESIDYAGITTKVLSNGYIRVTMNLAELTRSGCVDNRDGAPANVGVLDIYGSFTTADGLIANIKTK